MGLPYERSPCPFVEDSQHGRLRSSEPTKQQAASWQESTAQCRRQMSEWLLQNIRNYQIESRAPMVGRVTTEVDRHRVRVQGRVCFGTGQRKWIDVSAYDELSASSSGDSGKDAGTRSDVQHRSRLPLPTKQVNYAGAQTRRRMGSVPEDGSACYFLTTLGLRKLG